MLKEYIQQLNKLPQKIFTTCAELDTQKLTIGVICSQNELSLAHKNLDLLCQKVQQGIAECNANCKIAYVSSVDDTLLRNTQSGKYALPSRDLVACQVEMICSTECFNGVVFVASQPNVVCGMLLGALRINAPCAFLCQGIMSPIIFDGREQGYAHYAEQIALLKTGNTPYESLEEIENNLPLAFGTDCDSYSDNSFNCILELFGLALAKNGTTTAGTVTRYNIAKETGAFAVQLAQNKCTPRRLLTQTAITNAIRLDLACGGSTTTLMNLIALSKELQIKNVNLKTIGEMAKTTPLLLGKADKSLCLMTQFDKAGGTLALAKQLLVANLIDGKIQLPTGVTLQSALEQIKVANDDVIRTTENPWATVTSLQVLYGNVAEEGSFARSYAKTFSGVAKVYSNLEMAVEAILHREIVKGDVVVIRNEGPTSCPGMREVTLPFDLLNGYGLSNDVAVITDGRISDNYKGFAVGHITPETNGQSVLSILQDGDTIDINIAKGKISCDIKARDITVRIRNCDAQIGNYASPFLKNWAKNCDTATNGCVQIVGKK